MTNTHTTLRVKWTTRDLLDKTFDHHKMSYDEMIERLVRSKK